MSTILQLNDLFKVNNEYFSKQGYNIRNSSNQSKFIQCLKVNDETKLEYALKFSERTGQWDLYSWDGQQWGLEEANVKVTD